MTLALVFLANAGLSFALSLALGAILGPDGFGRYAIGSALATLIGVACLDWLRLSTTRFYSGRVRRERPDVRATLDRGVQVAALGIGLAAGTALLLGPMLAVPGGLVAAACLCGLAYGLCDYRLALARARFLEGPYILIAGLRGAAVCVAAAGAAILSGDPAIVLGAAAAGALLPVVLTRRRLADPPVPGGFRPDLLAGFARYGLPLVAAGALYQVLPLLNRAVLAEASGFRDAGYFGLASELATRLFQNLGAALDLVLFQLAVRAEEQLGSAAADRQVARNAAAIFAILLPAAAGWWLVWPSFEAVFVPVAFQGRLGGTMALMIPALAAFALAHYGLNAAFQLRRRTSPTIWAAGAALLADGAVLLLGPGDLGPERAATAQLAGCLAGLLTLTGLALRAGLVLPWRDVGGAALACALMLAGLWPFRDAAPSGLVLALQVGAGIALYGAAALLLDVAGARRVLVEGRWSDPAGGEGGPAGAIRR